MSKWSFFSIFRQIRVKFRQLCKQKVHTNFTETCTTDASQSTLSNNTTNARQLFYMWQRNAKKPRKQSFFRIFCNTSKKLKVLCKEIARTKYHQTCTSCSTLRALQIHAKAIARRFNVFQSEAPKWTKNAIFKNSLSSARDWPIFHIMNPQILLVILVALDIIYQLAKTIEKRLSPKNLRSKCDPAVIFTIFTTLKRPWETLAMQREICFQYCNIVLQLMKKTKKIPALKIQMRLVNYQKTHFWDCHFQSPYKCIIYACVLLRLRVKKFS
jgi:hypothetical protein